MTDGTSGLQRHMCALTHALLTSFVVAGKSYGIRTLSHGKSQILHEWSHLELVDIQRSTHDATRRPRQRGHMQGLRNSEKRVSHGIV